MGMLKVISGCVRVSVCVLLIINRIEHTRYRATEAVLSSLFTYIRCWTTQRLYFNLFIFPFCWKTSVFDKPNKTEDNAQSLLENIHLYTVRSSINILVVARVGDKKNDTLKSFCPYRQ